MLSDLCPGLHQQQRGPATHLHEQDGVLTAIVILLIANVLWHAIKAAIDRKLADVGDPGCRTRRRRESGRTLLPIFRNILFVVTSPSPC